MLLTSLPTEILSHVLSYLDGPDLAHVSQTSHRLNAVASHPVVWQNLAAIANLRIESPTPYESFKALYASLHKHLWLPGRIWHSDRRFTGYILFGRYNSSSGEIELINPVASTISGYHPFSIDPSIQVVNFEPTVRLWEEPLLRFSESSVPDSEGAITYPAMTNGLSPVKCSLIRAVELPEEAQSPSTQVWPPLVIPAPGRTRNESPSNFHSSHRPKKPEDASTNVFRVRKWMQFHSSYNIARVGVAMEDEVQTYSSLLPELYTPNEKHPWRGIWVGDYSVHGTEFILFHQPNERRLEAIKLTGDINIPRGEYSFIATNLSETLRVATEKEWPGARVVEAKGQIAESRMNNPQFIDCELILANPNEVALLWHFREDLAHINRYRRLDTDIFLYGDGVMDFGSETGSRTD